MANVEAISRARPDRLEAMVFGVADYAASVQARTTNIGGANPDYSVLTDPDPGSGARSIHWGDQWHFGISRMVAACRAQGLRPIDGPFGDYEDADGYRSAARRAAALGCEGKWAIHPSQVELANEVFTPAEAEIDRAERILQAMEEGAKEGQGGGLARRPPDRRGLDPHGREPDAQGRADARPLTSVHRTTERRGPPTGRGGER